MKVMRFYLVIFISIISLNLFSQQFVTYSYTPNYATMPMHYGSDNQLHHYTYDYTIEYQDSTVDYITGKIKYDKKADQYFIKSGKQRIYCNETTSIYRVTQKNDTIKGVTMDNKWLFPVLEGEITGHSIYASDEIAYITHLQKGDSSIHPYEKKFLKKGLVTLIGDDEEAYEMFQLAEKRRKIRAWGGPAICVVLLTTALIAPADGALAIASWLGFPVLPWTILFVKRIPPLEIIEVYNKNMKVKLSEIKP